ncbi:hypothetical protein [Streptomyces albicerus]|uniref:hypothetical protein n=1 Tax=Streptomyces albicerus TaxID=2569859 RepID=UPI00124B8011|nr:hypothetical protein [Streptomyces albicerus]
MAAKPLRLTAGWGLLGAVGGLIASAVMVGSGVLLPLFWSEKTALAVLGSAIGMATVVCWPTVILRVLSWHVAATAVVQFALMMTVAVLFKDAVLDHRGVRVTAVVSEIRDITQKDGGTGQVCRLRLPDGTSWEPTGWDTGCGADTEVGDRVRVHQDPEGLVPPQRSLWVTAPQYACSSARAWRRSSRWAP